jgi:hypothetical protein
MEYKKLQYYKISTNSMKWFESYLSLRKHNLCIGNNISNPEPVKYGVPQGSILVPLRSDKYDSNHFIEFVDRE